MFRKIVCIVMLLSIALFLTAQRHGLSQEEYRKRYDKTAALVEQMKKDTGFEGKVETSVPQVRIIGLEGMFKGIPAPVIGDDSGYERICDEIIDRLMPYIPANRSDLIKEYGYYRYKPNGYSIERNPRIVIGYNRHFNRFGVGMLIVPIDTSILPKEPVITEEEARQLAINRYREEGHRYDTIPTYVPEPDENGFIRPIVEILNDETIDILYAKNQETSPDSYSLYWRVSLPNRMYMINSVTGVIESAKDAEVNYFDVRTDGSSY